MRKTHCRSSERERLFEGRTTSPAEEPNSTCFDPGLLRVHAYLVYPHIFLATVTCAHGQYSESISKESLTSSSVGPQGLLDGSCSVRETCRVNQKRYIKLSKAGARYVIGCMRWVSLAYSIAYLEIVPSRYAKAPNAEGLREVRGSFMPNYS